LDGVAGKSPGEQAWIVGGGPRLRGVAEQLVSAGTILAEPKADVFQSGNPLSSSHAGDRLNGAKKSA
jgi:hypothetical protein